MSDQIVDDLFTDLPDMLRRAAFLLWQAEAGLAPEHPLREELKVHGRICTGRAERLLAWEPTLTTQALIDALYHRASVLMASPKLQETRDAKLLERAAQNLVDSLGMTVK
jgi:hypothetical protein